MIFDLIIVLYMCLTLLNVTSHVDAVNFVSASVWFVILFWIFLTWDSHFNFVFICNSKIRMFVLSVNCIFSKLIIVCILNFLKLLLKWISSYFVEKKIASWRRNHVVKISCSFSKVLQFSSVLVLYVSTFTLWGYGICVREDWWWIGGNKREQIASRDREKKHYASEKNIL